MKSQDQSRVTRTRAQAAASYDRLSRWYDLVSGGTEERYRNLGLDALGAQPGEQVLEIGCGTGHGILALAQAVGPAGRVYGIDISRGMLSMTRQRAERAGVSAWVALCLGDATQLPYQSGSLDAVFMSFALELFDTPEIPLVLAGCRRVLRPNGRIVLVVMARPERVGVALRLYEWAHARWPAVVDCRPIYAREALQEAGFKVEAAKRCRMWGLPVDIIRGIKE